LLEQARATTALYERKVLVFVSDASLDVLYAIEEHGDDVQQTGGNVNIATT